MQAYLAQRGLSRYFEILRDSCFDVSGTIALELSVCVELLMSVEKLQEEEKAAVCSDSASGHSAIPPPAVVDVAPMLAGPSVPGRRLQTTLSSLCGSWRDTEGSTYLLTMNAKGSIDVVTVRPFSSGKRWNWELTEWELKPEWEWTGSLIRIQSHAAGQRIVFGSRHPSWSYSLKDYRDKGSSLSWHRRGARPYYWSRIDETSFTEYQ